MRFLGLVAVVLTALLTASSAAARDRFICDGVFTGATYGDILVPRDGACTLINSTVTGDVKALRSAYFQATGTRIGGNVSGGDAQTIFIDTGSKVSGSVRGYRTRQVFVYNSRVAGSIDVERTSDVVQICGNTVLRGDISVERSGSDILIGDPLAVGCPGNLVKRGDVEIKNNLVQLELVIRGNKIKRGDLEVIRNTGPVPKIVEDNTGGDRLKCSGNGAPLLARDNRGWDHKQGQCANRSRQAGGRR